MLLVPGNTEKQGESIIPCHQDESLTPIFCKSKLIPLKTITTQKLEKMQKEQMEKLQKPEPVRVISCYQFIS